MHKRIDLDNGLRIILNHMPHMESTAIGIWIATGSRNEDAAVSGISHFLEHMLFKGTPKRPSRKIKEEIEGKGGSLNGFTSEEITCYLVKVSGRHMAIALDVLSDMVLNASLNKNDMERERTVIMEEIKMYRDLPNHHIHDVLGEIMWPGHPLGLSIAGSIDSVKSITRDSLSDYKKLNYIPENMALVLCGNLGRGPVIKNIERTFNVGAKIKPPAAVEFKNTQTKPRIKILNKATEQTRLSIGMHTFGRPHKDRYILALLHIILGANMSSRLFENVREKNGLAYEIGTEVRLCKDTGAFIINAGIDHKKAKEASVLVLKELTKIKEKPVPQDELKRAKEFFGVQLSLMLEDTADNMLWLGEHVITTDRIPDKKDIIEKVESVSPRDIQRVANNAFIASNINFAIIGPLGDKEKEGIEKELYNL